ncbi:GAF domain-containing protein [Thermotoga sp. KOL6]|uniref:GAF domain-containing protein n=1 Tax=Thermotoga sp. KOL6 TaxID=126741 RepID=UPI000C77E9F7|nr:GAF domain-containing protein [Thermotoga sp. KOL6]PLV59238.1 histidine kinase [Thermotoga sp. KOL6]
MRSIVQNKVEECLEILKWDKTKWPEFWGILRKKFGPIVPNYEKKLELGEEDIKNILWEIERRELDRFKWEWLDVSRNKKVECAEALSEREEFLELKREDFSVFLMSLLGICDWVVVDGEKEKIVVVDVFSLWRKGFLKDLSLVTLQAVIGLRRGEDKGNYEGKERYFEVLMKDVEKILTESKEPLKELCKFLRNHVPYYDWVGFYFVEDGKLKLGPFVGEPTEHVEIPFGIGICGQAAERRETFIVQDVSKETNYLSCSPKTKAEIVIPIFKDGEIIGELDIDSHSYSPFSEEDRKFLENVCSLVSKVV